MPIKTYKISNGALKGESLPKRLKFLNAGKNPSIVGDITVGDKTMTTLAANQARLGLERVAIDFNHCSVPGTTTYKDLLKQGQPPLIFGYGRVDAVAGDGLYLDDIVWTPLGVQHAKNFEDMSPALDDETGEVTVVHSLALTPNGKVTGLQFFSAKTESTTADLGAEADDKSGEANKASKAAGEASSTAIESGKDSDHAKAAKLHTKASEAHADAMVANAKAGKNDEAANNARAMKVHDAAAASHCDSSDKTKNMSTTMDANSLKLLAVTAGLPENATFEQITAAVAANKTLSVRLDKIEQTIATGAKATEDAERERIIKLFSVDGKSPKGEDGKDISVDAMRKMDVSTLKLLHANTAVTVPLSARSRTGMTEGDKPKTYVHRDTAGKVLSVDLAAIFNDEAERNGQLHPDVAIVGAQAN